MLFFMMQMMMQLQMQKKLNEYISATGFNIYTLMLLELFKNSYF